MDQQKRQKAREKRKRARDKYKFPEVRMTPETYALFEQQAQKENSGVSTVIGNMALAYLQGQRLPSLSEKEKLLAIENELAEVTALIRGVATNINQMTKHSNRLKVMVEEQGLYLYLKELDQSVRNTVNNLTLMDKK